MIITKEKTLSEIKEMFRSTFPGLKMEFYKSKHKSYEGSEKNQQYDENHTIAEVNPNITTGEISFLKGQTTKELEQAFEDLFGLHVQIFRRSNELWLQTSTTDDWTLEVQNRKGLHSIQS